MASQRAVDQESFPDFAGGVKPIGSRDGEERFDAGFKLGFRLTTNKGLASRGAFGLGRLEPDLGPKRVVGGKHIFQREGGCVRLPNPRKPAQHEQSNGYTPGRTLGLHAATHAKYLAR